MNPRSPALRPTTEITDRIVAGGEQSLLGLAFHPEYPDDDRFVVMYTAAEDGDLARCGRLDSREARKHIEQMGLDPEVAFALRS